MWSNLSRYSQLVVDAFSRGRVVGLEVTTSLKTKMAGSGIDIDWNRHRESVLRAPLGHQALGAVSVLPILYPVIHDIFTLSSSPILLSGQAIYVGCLLSYFGGFRGGRIFCGDDVKVMKEQKDNESGFSEQRDEADGYNQENLDGMRDGESKILGSRGQQLKNMQINDFNLENLKESVEKQQNYMGEPRNREFNYKNTIEKHNEITGAGDLKMKMKEGQGFNNEITEGKFSKKIEITDMFYVVGNHNLGDLNVTKDGLKRSRYVNKVEGEEHDLHDKSLGKTQLTNKRHLDQSNQNMGNSFLRNDEQEIPKVDNLASPIEVHDIEMVNNNLLKSVVPLAVACLALPQSATLCSVILMTGMGGLTYIDMKDVSYPHWLKSMRLLVTAVGISSMALTLLFSFIMPMSG